MPEDCGALVSIGSTSNVLRLLQLTFWLISSRKNREMSVSGRIDECSLSPILEVHLKCPDIEREQRKGKGMPEAQSCRREPLNGTYEMNGTTTFMTDTPSCSHCSLPA